MARQQQGASNSKQVSAPTEGSEIARRRIRAKNKVVKQLLAGEMSLAEAAAWFRFVNDNPPEFRCDFRSTMPGRCDGEKACRQVISWVEGELPNRMPLSQADLVLCRLQGELDALLARGDRVELPW
jgi:hypothetical protein